MNPCSPSPRTVISRYVALVGVGVAFTFGAAAAEGSVAAYRPIARSHHHLVFKPRGIRPQAVHSAKAVLQTTSGHRVRRRLNVRLVRRAIRRHSTIRVRATHNARSGKLLLSKRRLRADTTPPSTTITGGPAAGATTSDPTPTFTFSSSESNSTFKCRFDSDSFGACSASSSDTPSAALADGSHTFEVEAIDKAGNVDPTPASRSFTLDTATSSGGGSQSQSCGWGTFSFTSFPGACWRPYSDLSPFNTALPSLPSLVPNSSAIVSRAVGDGATSSAGPHWGWGDGLTSNDWSVPVYFSSPSDPSYTIHCTGAGGVCESGFPSSVRIPAGAKPAGGGDGHLAVIDQAANTEYDFWQAQKNDATHVLTASSAAAVDIGTAASTGLGGGADAGDYGLAAGQIRASELAAGEIDHALFMVVYCTNGTSVFPADPWSSGRRCSSVGLSNTNAPAMGQHFFLNMSDAEIAALQAPAWKKTILTAMAHYGMYVGDTGGGGGFAIEPESSDQYLAAGQQDPWARLGGQLGISSFDLRSVVPWASRLAVAAS